jgi:hypothetical protein
VRDAHEIPGAGDQDEEVVAQDHEPGREVAREANAAGALHDVERGRDEHVAPEGEDHRGGVERPQTPEARVFEPEVELRRPELEGDDAADEEARDAPDHRGDRRELDRAEIVVRLAGHLPRRRRRVARQIALQEEEQRSRAGGGAEVGVDAECGVLGACRAHQGQHDAGEQGKADARLAFRHVFVLDHGSHGSLVFGAGARANVYATGRPREL